ncbi:MAG: hypothetical protein JXB48_10965 [Candidatus Latescibacteria bacterium]|nr:hypothetical protein [Candidatus Latescibacterota bacterium]
MEFCGKSGTKMKCVGMTVELFEYPGISSAQLIKNKSFEMEEFLTYLLHTHPELTVEEQHVPVPVDDKWVYVFKKTNNTVSLTHELKPSNENEQQVFEYVSWKKENLESNRNSFPRTLAGKKLKKLLLDGNAEYFFLLSQIQLPLHRIDYYTANPQQLAHRAVNIRNDNAGETEPVRVKLIDFLAISDALNEEKAEAIKEQADYFSDTNDNTKRYLANMVVAIEKNRPKIKDWLDYDAVSNFIKTEDDTVERLKLKADTIKDLLKDWKLSSGYILTRDDYNGTEEYEKTIIQHEATVTSFDEIEYLAAIGKDDHSWFQKIFTNSEPFLFHRKLSNLGSSDDLAEVLSKHVVSRFLAKFPKTAKKAVYTTRTVYETQMKVVQELEEIIQRTAITFPDFAKTGNGKIFYLETKIKAPKIKYKFTTVAKTRAELDYIDTRAYDKAMSTWKQGVEKVAKPCQRILLGLEIINLYGSATSLAEAESTSEKVFGVVDLVGSFSDAVAATDFLFKQTLVKNIGKELAEKSFASVNIVGSVCDYVGALKNSYSAAAEDKWSLAFSYSTLGLAATAGMTSSVLTLTGGSSAAAVGISATGWGAIAVSLALIGATLVWVFTEEELEEWAKESEWGEDPSRRKSLVAQAQDLHQILGKFTVECYILRQIKNTYMTNNGNYHDYFDTLTLKIVPGFWNKKQSRFKATLHVEKNNIPLISERTLIDTKLELPDEKTKHFPAKKNQPAALIRRIATDELKYTPDFIHDEFSFSCSVQLDLNGDGSEMVPEKPLEESGRVEARGFDFM